MRPVRIRMALGVCLAVALLGTGAASALAVSGAASAVVGADTGSDATTVPIITPVDAASPEIQNDEPVQLVVPDGDLTPSSHVDIYECADPSGDVAAAYLADLSAYSCDALTNIQYTTDAQGGLTTPDPSVVGDAAGTGDPDADDAYTVYSLPNRAELDEHASNATCDLDDECILYIGPSLPDPADGAGVVYSRPFYVDPRYDYLAGHPAPAGTTAPVTTTTTAATTTTTTTTRSTTTTSNATGTTSTVPSTTTGEPAPTKTAPTGTTAAPAGHRRRPTVSIVASSTVARHGRVTTELSCHFSACVGSAGLLGHVAGSETGARVASAVAERSGNTGGHRDALVVLATGTFSLRAGSARPVVLRPTPSGRRWLASNRGHATAYMRISLRGGASTTRAIVVR